MNTPPTITVSDDLVLAQADAIRARREQERVNREIEIKRTLIGQCFRYRNSYSCPEKDSDYWWLYIRVDRVDEVGSLYGLTFEITNSPRIELCVDTWIANTTLTNPISPDLFARELAALKAKIAAL